LKAGDGAVGPLDTTADPAAPSTGPAPFGADFVALPGGGWHIWRGIVLRGAGLPLELVDGLGDEALAGAADQVLAATPSAGRRPRVDPEVHSRYEREFDIAASRLDAAVARIAREPLFREAVAWQNREVLRTCVDHARRPGRDSRTRTREATIASYLQRYTTKNDSIGYFGPIGWASWRPEEPGARVAPGESLIGRRTVYFEPWALDAVGAAFAARPELLVGVPPRPVPANHIDGDIVRLPVGTPVHLAPAHAAILKLCDGTRTVHEIAEAYPAPVSFVLEQLQSLQQDGLVCLDLGGPIQAFPERLLRQRLSRMPDLRARDAALGDLDRLIGARDALAAAAGDADAVVVAVDRLNEEFESLAGVKSTRMHGQTYAGRTIVYEDTVRDLDVQLGADLLGELGRPLSLILDSARWLAARIQQECLDNFDDYYERRRRRTSEVSLSSLLSLATRDFYTAGRATPVSAAASAELQRRWSAVLSVPRQVRRHSVTAADIAPAVAAAFAGDRPSWVGGLLHTPDVMIAASSVEAINRGDYQFVLGELHAAYNSVESRAIVEQSPDRQRLLSMAEALAGGRRIVPLAPRAWGAVTARTSPPGALQSPDWLYWSVGADDVADVPVPPVPVAALTVSRGDNGLVVRRRDTDQAFPLVEVIGEYLSGAAANAFKMLPSAPYSPRVAIDRLVVARETWRMPARKLGWAFQLDERRRYLQMREWLQRHGIPRYAFYSVSIETKPTFVDFTSVPLINVLAGVVRRMAKDAPDDNVTISEMLPDRAQAWLPDSKGGRYTSELRVVVAEPGC
jgi:hypothetical protein